MEGRGPLFREIHKNTWLKRIPIDNRKIAVGTKKPERCWVVFCVHDDCEALLEGYAEPRLAATHSPDWTISLQTTLHISHTLVPSEQEYEFVITLLTETVRFNAASWEIMQEWVDTLRLKLREMKILSPKENLYSKLPEVRAPLLPTRDPMSPLPATPPIPAAMVPGVERVIPNSISSNSRALAPSTSTASVPMQATATSAQTTDTDAPAADSLAAVTTTVPSSPTPTANTTSMSNTLTQNLINMLSNPVSAYSNQLNGLTSESETSSIVLEEDTYAASIDNTVHQITNELSETNIVERKSSNESDRSDVKRDSLPSLAQTFTNNVLSGANTFASTSGLSSYVGHNRESDRLNSAEVADTNVADSSSESIVSSTFPTPEPIVIPRPQTVKSSSRESKRNKQQQQRQPTPTAPTESNNDEVTTNITIIQVSSPLHTRKTKDMPEISIEDDTNYKSNVQIIPSNFNPPTAPAVDSNTTTDPTVTTVQVSTSSTATTYGKIVKKNTSASKAVSVNNGNGSANSMLLVGNETVSNEMTTFETPSATVRNYGPITNVPINAEKPVVSSTTQLHYEQVFVTPPATSSPKIGDGPNGPSSPIFGFGNKSKKPASHSEIHINRINLSKNEIEIIGTSGGASTSVTSVTVSVASTSGQKPRLTTQTQPSAVRSIEKAPSIQDVPRENAAITSVTALSRPLLTRGVTEAVIQRPSRQLVSRGKTKPQHTFISAEAQNNAFRNEVFEQRQRSSSTSDAQGLRNRSNNNNSSNNNNNSTGNQNNETRRIQMPPQPFRPNVENVPSPVTRLTLREQQVIHLRREMMHPGGVRLQLRRKDCIGSIALVDAFGGVWITGWKQKDHPMLYNALHIGDQLISIGGITVSSANDANKIIRNSQTLYIELLIRRIPFGRVYAIRRDIERQCLGLIRDGNTATIVDVVPNSLSARHGLPPKAQSCDGLSLSQWVLTEINGRPLNFFSKDHEVEDRLNAVGKDISILVQPSDLVSKLKKQLKSLRNYKDYIVQ